MGLGKAYLITFNWVLAAGWSAVLLALVQALVATCAPSECVGILPFGLARAVCTCGDLYSAVEMPLKVFQTAAVLEVVHTLFGLVRAPVFTTFIQVLSRQALLWAIVVPFPDTHTHPRFATMLIAWSVTEVIRYSFYGFNLLMGSAPYPLVWLRYTLFFALYPIGVGSEVALLYASLDNLAAIAPIWRTIFIYLMLLYIPGLPVLYLHMIGQRKKVLGGKGKKRKEVGIVFPPGKNNDRSTTDAGKQVFAAAVEPVDEKAAHAVRNERNWRFGYTKHIVSQVELCAASANNCLKIAEAGLAHLHDTFELITPQGTQNNWHSLFYFFSTCESRALLLIHSPTFVVQQAKR